MSTAEFLNSPLFIALLSVVFTIIGGLLKMLWSAIGKADERLKALEISTNDLATTKTSIANLGQRLGNVEARDQVQDEMFRQLNMNLSEIKESERQNNVAFASILESINEVKTDLSVIKFRLDNNDTHRS